MASTNRLLRTIAALLVRREGEKILPLREQIKILDGLGLMPAEIAGIIGRSNTYVSKELSGIRKNPKHGG